jgi:tellurite resistance protein TehA-like permease
MRPALQALPPGSQAAVMATGIVSVGLHLDGERVLSRIFLGLALIVWGALVCVAAARLLSDRWRFLAETLRPVSLCGVAATCVLATALTLQGRRVGPEILLAAGFALLVAELPRILLHAGLSRSGSRFLIPVSIFSVGVTGALLAVPMDAAWLVPAAAALCLGGLLAYIGVLMGFEVRELLSAHGDHWIAGGAVAIGAVAFADTATGSSTVGTLSDLHEPLRIASVVLFAAAMAWLPFLVAAELHRPRTGFHRSRWATAFPVGMYAVMSFTVGRMEGLGWIVDFARVWVWVGAAVWALVAAGAVLQGLRGA